MVWREEKIVSSRAWEYPVPMMMHQIICPSHLGIFRLFAIAALCLCVVTQLLGAPVTLLNPAAMADTLTASVLEGFSVPPSLPQLAPSHESARVQDIGPILHVPVLVSTLFHPPLP